MICNSMHIDRGESLSYRTLDLINSLSRDAVITQVPFNKMGKEFKRTNEQLFKVFNSYDKSILK